MVIDPAVFPRLIKRTDTHLYLLPHPRLRAMVAHYTVSFPGTGPVPDTLTLIPDASGCSVRDWAPDGVHSRLWGPTTKTVVVANDAVSYTHLAEMRAPHRLFLPEPGLCFHPQGKQLARLHDAGGRRVCVEGS